MTFNMKSSRFSVTIKNLYDSLLHRLVARAENLAELSSDEWNKKDISVLIVRGHKMINLSCKSLNYCN